MKKYASYGLMVALGCFVLSQVSFGQEAPSGMVKLDYKMPKPMFVGTPKNLKTPNLEPPRGDKPRPPTYVPPGCANLSLKKVNAASLPADGITPKEPDAEPTGSLPPPLPFGPKY